MSALNEIRNHIYIDLLGPDFTGLGGIRTWASTWILMPGYTDFNNIYAYVMAWSAAPPAGGGDGGSGGGGDAGGGADGGGDGGGE